MKLSFQRTIQNGISGPSTDVIFLIEEYFRMNISISGSETVQDDCIILENPRKIIFVITLSPIRKIMFSKTEAANI